jgi:hypothetical protein
MEKEEIIPTIPTIQAEPDIDLENLLNEIEDEELEAEATASAPPPSIPDPAMPVMPAGAAENKASDDISELSNNIMAHYQELQTKIWEQLNADRSMIDEYIAIFKEKVQGADTCKQYFVEALTALVTAKASTSANASKLLDSCAKMASAIKNMKASDIGGSSLLMKLLGDEGDYDPDKP